MGENANNDRMQQQPNDAQRQQVGQQNQQGERQEGRGIEGQGDGLAGGVDTGAIQPGKTGQGDVDR